MSFAQLFGRDTRFFELLRACSAEAKAAAHTLVLMLPRISHENGETLLGDIAQHRRKHKALVEEMTTRLTRVFNTPFEREDLQAMNSAIYKITKNTEKIAERLTIAPPDANIGRIRKQLEMIEHAAEVVETMIQELCAGRHGEVFKRTYDRIQAIEGDADKLMTECMRDLYHGTGDARVVIFWRDLYELTEKAIDRCRDAATAAFVTVLKNS